jgi:exodeoxyribonuclease V alpha subunit
MIATAGGSRGTAHSSEDTTVAYPAKGKNSRRWSEPSDDEELNGIVVKIVYRGEGGYIVARVAPGRTDSAAMLMTRRDTVTMVGAAPALQVGEIVTASGRWRHLSRYGTEFIAAAITRIQPQPRPVEQVSALECAIAYLGSRQISGIGQRTAARIAGSFGAELLEILDHAPMRLEEVRGIGRMRAEQIGVAWRASRNLRTILIHLWEVGIPLNEGLALHARFGDRSLHVLNERLAGSTPDDENAVASAMARREVVMDLTAL